VTTTVWFVMWNMLIQRLARSCAGPMSRLPHPWDLRMRAENRAVGLLQFLEPG